MDPATAAAGLSKMGADALAAYGVLSLSASKQCVQGVVATAFRVKRACHVSSKSADPDEAQKKSELANHIFDLAAAHEGRGCLSMIDALSASHLLWNQGVYSAEQLNSYLLFQLQNQVIGTSASVTLSNVLINQVRLPAMTAIRIAGGWWHNDDDDDEVPDLFD
jgi:hypothetical protein